MADFTRKNVNSVPTRNNAPGGLLGLDEAGSLVLVPFSQGGSSTGINWRGNYQATTLYAPRDAVSFNGSSWIARQNNTSQQPSAASAYWDLLAEKGDDATGGNYDDSAVRGLITQNTTAIQALQSSTQSAITNLSTRIGGAESSLSALASAFAQQNQQITGLGTRVAVLETLGSGGGTGTGTPGPAGMVWRGTYAANVAYAARDGVFHNGSSYIALQASTGQDPTNPLYWSIVAQRGSDGTGTAGPVGMNWRGTYGSTVSYAVRDVVSYGGSSWICVQAGTGQAPSASSTYWNLLAQRGDDGQAGGSGGGGLSSVARDSSLTGAGTTDSPLAVARPVPSGAAGQVVGYGQNGGLEPVTPQTWTLEQIQDAVAAMFTGGTHTGLKVVYDDANGTMNLVVETGSGGGNNPAPSATTAPSATPTAATVGQPVTLSLGTWANGTPTGVLMQGSTNRTSEISGGSWTPTVAGAWTWTVSATGPGGTTSAAAISGTATAAALAPIWETLSAPSVTIPTTIDVPSGQRDVYIPVTLSHTDRNSVYGFIKLLSNVSGNGFNVGDNAAQRSAHTGFETVYTWSPGDDLTHYIKLSRVSSDLVAGWSFNVVLTIRGASGSIEARAVTVRVVAGASHPAMPAQYHRPMRRLDLSQATRKNTFNPSNLPMADSGFINGQPAWRTRLAHGYSQDGNGETGLYMNVERFPNKAETPHSYDSTENALRLHSTAFPESDRAEYDGRLFRQQAAVIQGQTMDAVCGADGVWRMVAKIPVRRYSWPAFWLIGRGANGATGGYTAWPPEIDILEKFNQSYGAADTPYTTTFAQHYGNAGSNNRIGNFGNEVESNKWIKDTGRMDWDYHSWAVSVVYDPVDTRKSEVTFFFDDIEVGCQILFARHQDMTTRMQFYPIANVAVRAPSSYTQTQYNTDDGRGNTGDMWIRDIAYYPTGALMPAASYPLVAAAEPRMTFARRASTFGMALSSVSATGFSAAVSATRAYAAWRSRFPVGTRVQMTVTVTMGSATGAVIVRSADDDAFSVNAQQHADFTASGTYSVDFTVTAAQAKPWFGFLSTANGATFSVSNLVLTYPSSSTPANRVAPTVSGDTQAGGTLSTSDGEWSE